MRQRRLTLTQRENIELEGMTYPATDAFFLWKSERVNELQPLIYNELLPRGLHWASVLEHRFPAFHAGRTKVPFVWGPEAECIIDGNLKESHWFYEEEASGIRGVLESRPGYRPGWLKLVYSDEGLYLGLRSHRILDVDRSGVTIAILREFSIPVWKSDRWLVTLEGEKDLQTFYYRQSVVVPWECTWELATSMAGDGWQMEAFIPFESFGDDARPEPGDRWRMNVTVFETQDVPNQDHVLEWGYPVPNQVEHGAVLTFGDRPKIETQEARRR